ncbi:MAG TPA: hypothetical protein VGH74_05935 [Planctomycetaceae bacterium]|jgi:hypothetical protein
MNDTRHVDAGLELLLDTICNTFGGVLFISMLVITMTNVAGQKAALTPPSDEAQAELASWTEALAAARNELDSLEEALKNQREIDERLAPAELRQRAARLHELKQRFAEQTDARNKALQGAGLAQQEVNEAAKQVRQIVDALAAARAALDDSRKRLRDEQAFRSRTAKLPRQHKTRKQEIAYTLYEGRLRALTRLTRDGRFEADLDECVETTEGGMTFLGPRPGAGLEIDPRGDAGREIARKLSQNDNSRIFLTLFVWPDSFAHFAAVRDVMVRLKFDYQLVPMLSTVTRIGVGPGSQSEATVQ